MKEEEHTGCGAIRLERAHGNLHLSDLSFTYPLKLVAPKPSVKCQSVFILSYGGGLVGGDAIQLSVILERDTTIALMTQGSTKIFKERPGLPATRQDMHVTIGEEAICLLIPDPVQPFSGSSYLQHQRFELHTNANLILLDWVLSGRPANGECWDFNHFTSTNSIYSIAPAAAAAATASSSLSGPARLMLRDCQIMKREETKRQMSSMNCIATLLFCGPATHAASDLILHRFKHEDRIRGHAGSRVPHVTGMVANLIWTVTRHRDVTVVKVAGQSSEQVKDCLGAMVDSFSWRQQFGRDAFRALE